MNIYRIDKNRKVIHDLGIIIYCNDKRNKVVTNNNILEGVNFSEIIVCDKKYSVGDSISEDEKNMINQYKKLESEDIIENLIKELAEMKLSNIEKDKLIMKATKELTNVKLDMIQMKGGK